MASGPAGASRSSTPAMTSFPGSSFCVESVESCNFLTVGVSEAAAGCRGNAPTSAGSSTLASGVPPVRISPVVEAFPTVVKSNSTFSPSNYENVEKALL